ncbi:MAG: ATP-dependent helicase [Treponema sp.]|nr:ATP-dependent helicase [Treponema sp.]
MNELNPMEEYLAVLNEEQRQAVEHEGSSLLILAGAGSGKTRVITTKIAYLINQKNVNPFSILSVTFTKKAANEMRERAVAMEEQAQHSQIRTFHSFGSWFLRKFAEDVGLESSFTVYDDEDMATLVKKAVPTLSTKESHVVAHQIALCKDYCLTPEDDLSITASEFNLNEIYSAYEKRLRATGNVDFGDLIMMPVKVMEESPIISSYIHQRFSVIMVDEYQDSNIAQYRLLQELSGVKSDSPAYVCVVGDDDQSIYHFRGAEVQNILTFPDKFPGTDIIRLERNYRSTSKILSLAELAVKNNSGRLGKNLIAHRGEGGTPALIFVDDYTQEAFICGNLIKKSVERGQKYSDWAILYRTNAQSLNFEKEFLHKKIPYVVVGSLKFYEREEIKDALAYLSLCANPKDEISFRRIVNKPARGIGEKTQDKILTQALQTRTDDNGELSLYYEDLLVTLKNMSGELSKKARDGAESFCKMFEIFANNFNSSKKLSDFIELVIQDSGLNDYHKATDEIEGTQRVANLQELVNSASSYEGSVDGLVAFLDAINLDRSLEEESEKNGNSNDAVTLITLHNTKGLEYNNVIITGLEEGIFPRADKSVSDLEEERRLFYVGITRAKNELYVTSAQKRVMYGSLQYMRPSIFLQEAAAGFKIIGRTPFGFNPLGGKSKNAGVTFGKNADSFASSNASQEISQVQQELMEKWKKGAKLFHDEYGYGIITAANMVEGEFKITVAFENGGKKVFLPEYQQKSLTLIKD